MAAVLTSQLSEFAQDVLAGLSDSGQKRLPPKYFYDDLGSALFEAITLLPEYGLTRADEELLTANAESIVRLAKYPEVVIELGSGSGRKSRHILTALRQPLYRPIDISGAALAACRSQLQDVAVIDPIEGEWLSSLESIAAERFRKPMLLLFLGSSIGNCGRADLPAFFSSLRECLRPEDHFLMGADLIKPTGMMLRAYNDPTGVTAAFNLNLLARINRELGSSFDLRAFAHESRWNGTDRAVEMHLVALSPQSVRIPGLGMTVKFKEGESIWTESSHKFTLSELDEYAAVSGFAPVASWTADDWPFAEVLWRPS